MNTWNGSGFLTRDPEMRYSQKQNGETMTIARFSIACQRKGKDAGADFINCTAFGKNGELMEKWFHRGMGIEVRGHIQTSQWTNKEGQKQYDTSVVVDEIEFPKNRKGEDSTPVAQEHDNAPQGSTYTPKTQSAPDDGFMNIPEGIESELPFR